ncbi:MEDS domain-containing protein [Bacillus sp. B1-b2]|uniref:MEDS domain-containing protein n=1 Tax=Bacillus sp. B1-b2 TaxID=2653201 RepID=UPI0012615904|nr:MEDS domain-containing protein [Bacillus sp. B1-b2]KAB7667130.1 3-ketoacyl-ACP reductase [Bacillus sp. B1-b2]
MKDITRLFSQKSHIFYSFEVIEQYIEDAIFFAIHGIKKGEYILFIENDRLFPLIYKKLELKLDKYELEKIHHINSLDFYFFNDDFHTPTIIKYFSNYLSPFLTNNKLIRTWAHVEWGNAKEIIKKIEEFEMEADRFVSEEKLLSVCAYDKGRLSNEMINSLMKSHQYYMTDYEIHPTYQKLH